MAYPYIAETANTHLYPMDVLNYLVPSLLGHVRTAVCRPPSLMNSPVFPQSYPMRELHAWCHMGI